MTQVSTVPVAFLAGMEAAVNAALSLDPDTLARLAALSGKVIAIEVQGFGVTVYLLPGPEGLQLMSRFDGEPDAILGGPPLALLRTAITERPAGSLFSGEVKIRGDLELGQRFQAILQRLDFDWEEHLASLTGDMVAHEAGNLARGARHWFARVAETFGRNLSEYLQEETNALPTRGEIESFLDAVDELRADVDRIEARIRRLKTHIEMADRQ